MYKFFLGRVVFLEGRFDNIVICGVWECPQGLSVWEREM